MAYVSPVLSSIKESLCKILRNESLEEAHFRSLYRENQLSIWDESLNGLDIRNRQVIKFLPFINDPIHPIHPSSIARYKMNRC